ncbi:hypothetical protein [Gordonia sp. OPL2]|uniref:hypothetical protein n=1 Tax=Gordonia sp. OPL2 TaxID=2486274 RepID=UPI0016554EE0|nr:hypothetical protein [Gordonia sp. OPL2]
MTDQKSAAELRREQANERRAAIRRCGRCDPNGWLIIAGKAHRCDHGAKADPA